MPTPEHNYVPAEQIDSDPGSRATVNRYLTASLSISAVQADSLSRQHVLFDMDDAAISKQDKDKLRELSSRCSERYAIYIVGFTDPAGGHQRNNELAHERAQALYQAINTQSHHRVVISAAPAWFGVKGDGRRGELLCQID